MRTQPRVAPSYRSVRITEAVKYQKRIDNIISNLKSNSINDIDKLSIVKYAIKELKKYKKELKTEINKL